jgi:hypothetical protein
MMCFIADALSVRVQWGHPAWFEKTRIVLASDDFTMLSNKPVRVSLLEGKHQLVYVFSTFVPVSYVIANLRTRAKVLQAVTAHSTITRDGTYVVQESIDVGGLSLTPTKTGLY